MNWRVCFSTFLMSTSIVGTGHAAAPTAQDLKVESTIQQMGKDNCDRSTSGTSTDMSAKAGLDVTAKGLASKLVDAKAHAVVGAQRKDWHGPQQSDAAQAQKNGNDCVINYERGIWDRYPISDSITHKPIQKPARLITATTTATAPATPASAEPASQFKVEHTLVLGGAGLIETCGRPVNAQFINSFMDGPPGSHMISTCPPSLPRDPPQVPSTVPAVGH